MSGEARPGDYRVICDRSGFKVWASETVKEWNGLRVHRSFADMSRHPQDFLRGVPDRQAVADPRPEAPDTFLAAGDVTEADL